MLAKNDLQSAHKECDRQRGSVASVIKSCLIKYEDVEKDTVMAKEQKLVAIQKEVEEATSLELPTLEQNLNILATIASISTLLGLLGTVLGMIRAFAALANAGAPDSIALATGISEALINTAFGIGTSALAIIFYNFFTSKIDKLTYGIDEAGFTIVQTYAANHKA
jgi:biopolymer transport protein ExbB